MKKGNPRNRLSVCIIEQHPPAARYLRGVLSKRKFSLVIPDNVNILPARINELKRSSIYLIDQESIPVPLVAYARSITRAHGRVKILATGRTLPLRWGYTTDTRRSTWYGQATCLMMGRAFGLRSSTVKGFPGRITLGRASQWHLELASGFEPYGC